MKYSNKKNILFYPLNTIVLIMAMISASSSIHAEIVINEILASNGMTNVDEDGESSDWIEIINYAFNPVDIGGLSVSDDPLRPGKWVFPSRVLEPFEYLLVWCSGKDRTTVSGDALATVDFDPVLVSLKDTWLYLTGTPDEEGPPEDWMLPGFDDSSWSRGRPGFGFGDNDDNTVFPEGITAAFLRRTFTLSEGANLSNLVFQVRYDDGFVLYLNGSTVLSVNFAGGQDPVFASRATRPSEANRDVRFDLSNAIEILHPGDNLMAIALLNYSTASSDLSLFPELGTVSPVCHTNFCLDSDGETVTLSDHNGTVIDRIVYPRQYRDQSWARQPGITGEFLYHLTPTPAFANKGNSSVDPLIVADTTFSVDRGFYDKPFD